MAKGFFKNNWDNLLVGALGGPLAGLAYNNYEKQKGSETDISKQKKALESSLKKLPTYQIPQEAQDYLKMLEQTSEDLGKTAQPFNEAVQIARNQSKTEAPGSQLARQDIEQSTAQQIQALKEAGGGSVDVLGAISKVGQSEQSALRDLAKSNLQYQAQAKQNLQGALMGQSQFQAGILGEQAQLKGAGLQTILGEKGKVYQSQLDKELTMIDYKIAQQGISQQELENLKNRRAQLISSTLSGAANIGSSLAGGA